MDIEEKVALAKRNAAEIVSNEELLQLISTKSKPAVYLGRAITGPLHLGHLVSLGKLLDLQKAGFETIVLLADIHAALDDLKCSWEDLGIRTEYTRKAIELSLDWREKPKMVKGSDFQLGRDYQMDIFKFSTILTVKKALHAASEVTRMKNPKVSELIYPIMQALDEQYLGVDMQLGGLDQRHILVMAREYLPELGYKKRVELMMPLMPSLLGPGVKMSSSMEGSHLKVNASEKEIKDTINGAYCPAGVVEDNPLIAFASWFVLPNDGKFVIERDNKFGGDVEITSEAQLKELFMAKKLHPLDLKNFIIGYLTKKLARSRAYFESNQDLLKQLGPRFQ
ncbi:MAG: tyrosine--tRNA ligase [Candidatus Micrarchaeales archaeon]|nr:tyrosine--tRNA ligase [Candidatus Micrarchaeales archaeon]